MPEGAEICTGLADLTEGTG